MKKKLLLLFACCILLGAFAIGASAADATEPTIAIKSGQLAFENTVYLQYAVEAKNVSGYNDVKLLVWLTPQDEYVNNGTQDYTLDCAYTFDNKGTLRGRYILDDLAASEMTVDVYTVAYYTKGGNEYYSPLIKYSMLQYIYNKLGYTGTSPSTDENYIALLENMLEYGAAAQTYFGENLDRLATNPFYELTVTNGFLADGTAKGLYCEGEDIVLVANPATGGQRFSHWTNSKGESVGTDATLTIKMGNKAETYTANYSSAKSVTIVNGTLSGGSATGTFYAGESFTITASTPANERFSHWTNSKGETVGNTETLTLTMGSASETYTANWVAKVTITVSGGLIQGYSNSVSSVSVYPGDSLKLIARNSSGKKFSHWTNSKGEIVGNTSTITITIPNTSETYTVNYIIPSAVTVVNGTLSDGTSTGSFYSGDTFTLVANDPESGYEFLNWTNSLGAVVGTTATLTLTMGESAQTYTANFRMSETPTSYFNFTEITDDSGNIIAYCIAPVSRTNLPADIVLPSTYNGKPVTAIKDAAFSSATVVKTVYIPTSYTEIGSRAFYRCTGLTVINIPATVLTIGSNAFPKNSASVYNCDAAFAPAGWATSWASSAPNVNWACNNVTTNALFDYVVYNGEAHITAYKGDSVSVEIPAQIDGYTVVSVGGTFSLNATLEELVLPASIREMNSYNLLGSTSLRLVYSYAAAKPAIWTADWVSDSTVVFFGYTGEPIVVKLTLLDEHGTGYTEEITIAFGDAYTLPELQLYGYLFLGWYNGDTKVEAGNWSYTTDVTLEARWELAIDEDGVLTPEDKWD